MAGVTCLIPARGGSKRIPCKNTRDFIGVPILQRVIDIAKVSGLFDRVVVSSEDSCTLHMAGIWGADQLYCSTEYAHRDDSMLEDVLDHFITQYPECTEVCMLLATAALVTPDDLKTARELFCLMHGLPVISYIAHGRDAGQFYFIDVEKYQQIRIYGAEILDAIHVAFPFDKDNIQDINTEEDWAAAEEKYRRLHGT